MSGFQAAPVGCSQNVLVHRLNNPSSFGRICNEYWFVFVSMQFGHQNHSMYSILLTIVDLVVL